MPTEITISEKAIINRIRKATNAFRAQEITVDDLRKVMGESRDACGERWEVVKITALG